MNGIECPQTEVVGGITKIIGMQATDTAKKAFDAVKKQVA